MYTWKQRIVAVFAFVCCLMTPVSVTAQDTMAVNSSASSAILYDPSSGRILYEKLAHVKRPMASTTKLMTALLAVELLPSETILTASEEALCVIGSRMGLCVGDTVTRDDLLYGLLLSSGNDAANVFALSMAGSYEEFADLMNARAEELGMTNTRFVTPSGLDADGHGSSAYDMALLAAEVLDNDRLATICAARTATVTVGDRQITLTNHNKLLALYPDAVGMKTGYTSQAGRCLVSAAKRDGVTLIAVTLDCANDWEEHMTMYEEGFSLLTAVTLSPPSLPMLSVYGGESPEVALCAESVTVSVLSEDRELIETTTVIEPFVWAPMTAGETVGRIEYRLRGTLVATSPVVTAEAVVLQNEKSWLWKTARLFKRLFCEAVT